MTRTWFDETNSPSDSPEQASDLNPEKNPVVHRPETNFRNPNFWNFPAPPVSSISVSVFFGSTTFWRLLRRRR